MQPKLTRSAYLGAVASVTSDRSQESHQQKPWPPGLFYIYMLSARITVETSVDKYTISGKSPCGPDRMLRLKVYFSAPWTLVWSWLRIHLQWARSSKSSRYISAVFAIALVLVAIGLSFLAHWHQVEVFGNTNRISHRPFREPEPPVAKPLVAMNLSDGLTPALVDANAKTKWNDWVRIALLGLGLPLVVFGAMAVYLLRRQLCDLYVVVLEPHEPFPVIEQLLARSIDKHVFAVRALGRDTRRRFFLAYDDPALVDAVHLTTTLHVTHQHPYSERRALSVIDPVGYWALIRYAIGLMLAPGTASSMRSLSFTYKQYEALFISYFAMLGAVIFLPSSGWIDPAESSQFPLVMAGIGVLWAVVFIAVSRGKTDHLIAWERLTATLPFRGCPIFRYSEREQSEGVWEELDFDSFEAPIYQLGLSHSDLQQLLLSVMLIAYFTVLQIVK